MSEKTEELSVTFNVEVLNQLAIVESKKLIGFDGSKKYSCSTVFNEDGEFTGIKVEAANE